MKVSIKKLTTYSELVEFLSEKNPYLHMVPKSDTVKALLNRSEKHAGEWKIEEADAVGWRRKTDTNTGVFENAL